MNLDEFHASCGAGSPPAGMGGSLLALWHDGAGNWRRAHEIVQAADSKTAARVHAYLHRKEGDLDNARYWYTRAGTALPDATLDQEWKMLARRLLNDDSAA